MTEFGRTPFLTASEFEAMGYKMVIWPVSSLRVANKAQAELYKALKRDGGTHNVLDRMQTRAELYDLIGLKAFEALDASIVATVHAGGAALRCCGGGGRRWFLVSVNGSAAIAGSVEECDQMPGACEHAVAVQRPGGPFEVKADDRRLGSRVAGFRLRRA